MAWDEALLETSAQRPFPVFRTYSWSMPCATFGYFQRWNEVSEWTSLRPLIRRPTGGGLVSHAEDWTYSLAVPPTHAWYRLTATESYRCLHEWIRTAFVRMGVFPELASCGQSEGPGRCFVGAERFDLLWRGRKLAGAAQRRNRMGLLIQGSIQPPPAGVSRGDWESAMQHVAGETSGIQWERRGSEAPVERRVAVLAGEKYASESYLRKR